MISIIKTRVICILLCSIFLLSASACTARDNPSSSFSSEISVTEEAVPEVWIIPDIEAVTAGIDLRVPEELTINRPLKDIEIDAENYYITGCSDPSADLLLNGEKVENRGKLGSFGVYAELYEGENTFIFTQGNTQKTVTITRKVDTEIYTTSIITKPSPEADDVIRSGDSYTLRCVAPSGASVTARVQGKTIELKQKASTAIEGVPATLSGDFIPDKISGTENIGSVTYTLNWQGKESDHVSPGSLFVTGSSTPLLVRVQDVSTTVFADESDESDYFATLKHGAVDIATEIGEDMYRLAMGGWAFKASLEPLTVPVETENKVTSTIFTSENGTETIMIKGTSAAPYTAEWKDGQIIFNFFRTSGLEKISVKGSELFTDVQAAPDGENMAIAFQLSKNNPLWGYLVEYKEDGILLTFKPAPKLRNGNMPLRDITIVLDPGHGGTDSGTSGIASESEDGVREKDINLATAKAARIYLEALGATIVMTREDDDTVNINERLKIIQQPEVDFAFSLHCNSTLANRDGTRPSGTEVYYYEDAAAPLAESVLQKICESTGRDNRGTQQANYKVTLNSNAPSVIVEMGFVTNPREYDELRDKQEIYDIAAGIADGIIAMLKP